MSGHQVLKVVRKYVKKEGRVGFELRELNQLFRLGSRLQEILPEIAKHITLVSALKILMLVHRVILEGSQPHESLLLLLSKIRYQTTGDLEELLASRLLDPYRLYLQRRVLVWSWFPEVPSRSERQIRFYQLFNLITLGVSFRDVIYTLGRYYMDKFGCAIDFNILLGADVQGLYHGMVECVERPAKKALLSQIEMLHEKMYVVYYNCYFHKYLKTYLPKWVITDLEGRTKRGDSNYHKRSASSAKTKANTPVRGKQESMEDSCLFLMGEESKQNKEGLKLLLSMERVVNESLG